MIPLEDQGFWGMIMELEQVGVDCSRLRAYSRYWVGKDIECKDYCTRVMRHLEKYEPDFRQVIDKELETLENT